MGCRTPLFVLGACVCLTSCQRSHPTTEQARVAETFASWKAAVIHRQPAQAMSYIPSHVDDYLQSLNAPVSPVPTATDASLPRTVSAQPASQSPGVDLLLRRALEKKVPADLRAHLTLAALFQRITDRHLFNPRDLREITIGPVAIDGVHANALVYYDGTLTALRLPFVKEAGGWKIDVMAILPSAEMLMRVDRAIKGETESQQVDQLVAKLPSL